MRNAALGVVLVLVVMLGAHAIALSGLQSDIQMLDTELDQMLQEEEQQKMELEREMEAELFPEVPEALLEQHRQAASSESEFIVIKVNGVPVELTDVPRFSWFSPYVRDIANRGIVSGYRDENGLPTGIFGSGDNVTIEQLAKIAAEAVGTDQLNCGEELKNKVVEGSWSEPYIRCAEFYNWAAFSDGSVDPTRAASRAEVVVTILQAFEVKFDQFTGAIFTDVDTSTEFAAAVETAASDSIVSGYTNDDGSLTGEFGPSNPVKRAEIAKILSLAMQVYGE